VFKDLKPIELDYYKFPYWTHVLGQFISASTLAGVVLWGVYAVVDSIFINKKV